MPPLPSALLALLLGLADGPPAAADVKPDPIEGKWIGMAGPPQDRVELGLEFKRDDKGEIRVRVYQHVSNFYGMEWPGAVRREGEKYLNPPVLTATLRDGKLEGTYMSPPMPFSLRRTETLPSEVPVPDLPRGPGPTWHAKLGGAIYAPAAVYDGVAYVGTTGGIFNAIDTRDGSFVWTFVSGRPLHGEALVTDEHVYFVCDNGYLFKLARQTGKEVWRYDLGDERVARPLGHRILDKQGIGQYDFDHTAPRPLLADGVLYVGSGDGGFHAVEAATGKRVWRFQGKGKVRTSAALDGPRVFFGTFENMVYAVDRQTGKEVWSKNTYAEVTSSPVLVGGRLLVGNRGGLLAALDPADGKVVWRMVFWGSSVESTPAPGDGGLFYIGSSDLRRISLIDSKDGRVVWRTDVFGIPWPRPLVTEKLVFASAAGCNPYQMRHLGSLTALDRVTGKIVWRWPVPESLALYTGFVAAPAVAGKTVVVGGLDGTLYGFPVG